MAIQHLWRPVVHPDSFQWIAPSKDGLLLATTSKDKSCKIFDVVNFGLLFSPFQFFFSLLFSFFFFFVHFLLTVMLQTWLICSSLISCQSVAPGFTSVVKHRPCWQCKATFRFYYHFCFCFRFRFRFLSSSWPCFPFNHHAGLLWAQMTFTYTMQGQPTSHCTQWQCITFLLWPWRYFSTFLSLIHCLLRIVLVV